MKQNFKIKIPKMVLFFIISYITVIVFLENFVHSSDFSILSLRCIDDVAFQASLNKYFNVSGSDLLLMNDYGYGWFFWFPMYLLTYPAHLLQSATGVGWLLIVLPRMHSLFFAVMCSILAYKIVSVYTDNGWIKMVVVMLMPMFPVDGYMAGRFSPNNQTACFAMLSLYLLIKNNNIDRKKLRSVLCIFALAMATKASAVCIAPMLTLLILSKYNWRFSKSNLIVWIQESVLAIFLMLFFMSPAVMLPFVNFNNAKQSANILLTYILERQTNADIVENVFYTIGFSMGKNVGVFLIAMLMFSAIIIYRNREEKRKDYLWISLGYLVGLIYLSATVSVGSIYVFNYLFPICFAFPFGFLGLQYIKIKNEQVKKIVIICVSIFFTGLQLYNIAEKINCESEYNLLAYYQNSRKSEEKKKCIYAMEKTLDELNMEQINLCIDYLGPISFYSVQEHSNVGICLSYWNNMGELYNDNTNIIVLSKDSIGFYSDSEFENEINSLDIREKDKYLKDRNARNMLVQTDSYAGKEWEKIYEDDYTYMYKLKE